MGLVKNTTGTFTFHIVNLKRFAYKVVDEAKKLFTFHIVNLKL
ncbi:hypothetical protein QGU_2334 [Clostridioides difficile 655]|nr:hypothetical protein QGU_2334 [Clostridioides difficile 655]